MSCMLSFNRSIESSGRKGGTRIGVHGALI